MWLALSKQYWNLSIFREKPENTPYSHFVLGVAVIVYFLLIVFQWIATDARQQLPFIMACLIAGSLIVSYALYTFVLLLLFGFKARFVQTLTCLFACHSIVHMFAMPLLLTLPILMGLASESLMSSFIAIIYLALTLMMAVWQLVLSVFIYKQALTVPYLSAILAGIGLLASNILMVSLW